jgi:hypothetical protein
MALLAHITPEQAEELTGQQYAEGSFFNPIQIGAEWYISAEEVRDCVTVDWVKDLEVTEVEIPVEDIELPNEND